MNKNILADNLMIAGTLMKLTGIDGLELLDSMHEDEIMIDDDAPITYLNHDDLTLMGKPFELSWSFRRIGKKDTAMLSLTFNSSNDLSSTFKLLYELGDIINEDLLIEGLEDGGLVSFTFDDVKDKIVPSEFIETCLTKLNDPKAEECVKALMDTIRD